MEGKSPGRLSSLLKAILSPERLDELPVAAAGRARPSLFGTLVARDELPEDVPVRLEKEGFLSRLFGHENLPLDPEPAPSGRVPFLRRLFGREQLPEDPVAASRPWRARGGRA